LKNRWLELALKGLALAVLVLSVYMDERAEYLAGKSREQAKPTYIELGRKIVERLGSENSWVGTVRSDVKLTPGIYPLCGVSLKNTDFSQIAERLIVEPVFLNCGKPVYLLLQLPDTLDVRADTLKLKSLVWKGRSLEINADLIHLVKHKGSNDAGGAPEETAVKRPVGIVSLGRVDAGPYRVKLKLKSLWTDQKSGRKRPLPVPDHKKTPRSALKRHFFVNECLDKGWGKITKGVQARLAIARTRVAPGQSLFFRVEVRNASETAVKMLMMGRLFKDFQPVLKRSSGGGVAILPLSYAETPGSHKVITLEPGRVESLRFVLPTREGYATGPLAKGKYTLTLLYGMSRPAAVEAGCAECWTGALRTRTVEFEVGADSN